LASQEGFCSVELVFFKFLCSLDIFLFYESTSATLSNSSNPVKKTQRFNAVNIKPTTTPILSQFNPESILTTWTKSSACHTLSWTKFRSKNR